MKRFFFFLFFFSTIHGCTRVEPVGVSFSKDILPVLNRSCIPCHNQDWPQGNIDLSSYNALMESRYFSREKPIALPGNSHDSRLYIVVTTRREGIRMPPDDSGFRRISDRNAEMIRVWIEESARNN